MDVRRFFSAAASRSAPGLRAAVAAKLSTVRFAKRGRRDHLAIPPRSGQHGNCCGRKRDRSSPGYRICAKARAGVPGRSPPPYSSSLSVALGPGIVDLPVDGLLDRVGSYPSSSSIGRASSRKLQDLPCESEVQGFVDTALERLLHDEIERAQMVDAVATDRALQQGPEILLEAPWRGDGVPGRRTSSAWRKLKRIVAAHQPALYGPATMSR